MSTIKTRELILALYKIGAVKFGNFALKSGQTSKIYMDLRKMVSYPALLHNVAEVMWEKVRDVRCDLLCGVPYTALPIATAISLEHDLPMVLRRKEKKSYGTKQQVEGVFQRGQRCLIVEDVITTGSSILETADDLEAVGLEVHDAIVLIDREQTGKNHLSERGYTLHAVLTLHDILHELEASDVATPEEKSLISELLRCNA
jgi:orotate phosphoribosyltransferase